ncbi:MAG: hypothetical protein LBM38_04690 [Clostridiales bacterium]|nr:hypothetical protein [Clostridiales bacterium]
MSGASNAIDACINVLVPSLLPFIIVSKIVINTPLPRLAARRLECVMRPIFGVSGAGAFPLIIGLLSGYPLGAKVVLDMYKKGSLSYKDAEKLISFCNNSGPLFIIGAIGVGCFNSVKAGVMVYIAHVISAIVLGIGIRCKCGRGGSCRERAGVAEGVAKNVANGTIDFGEAILDGVKTMALICGYVIFFGAIIGVLTPIVYVLPTSIAGLISGIIEMTTGIMMLAGKWSCLPLITFLVTFGGISVFMQIKGIVGNTFSMRVFIVRKLIQGVVAAGVFYLMQMMMPLTSVVSKSIIETPMYHPRGLLLYAMILSLCSVAVCLGACGMTQKANEK